MSCEADTGSHDTASLSHSLRTQCTHSGLPCGQLHSMDDLFREISNLESSLPRSQALAPELVKRTFQRRRQPKAPDPDDVQCLADTVPTGADGSAGVSPSPSTTSSSSTDGSPANSAEPGSTVSAACAWVCPTLSRARRSSLMPAAVLFDGTVGAEQPGTRSMRYGRALTKAQQKALQAHIKDMAQLYAEVDAFELLEETPVTAKRTKPHTVTANKAQPRARASTAGDTNAEQDSPQSSGCDAAAAAASSREQQEGAPVALPERRATRSNSLAADLAACTPIHSKQGLTHVATPALSPSTSAIPATDVSDLASTTPHSSTATKQELCSSTTPASEGADEHSDLSAAPTPHTQANSQQGAGAICSRMSAPSTADSAPSSADSDAAGELGHAEAAADWATKARGRRSSILAHTQQASDQAAAQKLQQLQRLSSNYRARLSLAAAPAVDSDQQWQLEQQRGQHEQHQQQRPGRLSTAELHRRLSLAGAAGNQQQHRFSLAGVGMPQQRHSLAAATRLSLAGGADEAKKHSLAAGALLPQQAAESAEAQAAAAADLEGVVDDLQGLRIEEGEEEEEQEGMGVEEKAAAVALTALEQLLKVCGQELDTSSLPTLEGLLGDLADLRTVAKIGEGTYGEAFRASGVVFKIIPMEGAALVNEAPQKLAGDILAEAVIALTLSRLREAQDASGMPHTSHTPAFVTTHRVGAARGPYPSRLIKAWRAWDKKNGSENDPVDGFGADQLFGVFAMADCGKDLEAYQLAGYEQGRCMLLQVAMALAVAEEAVAFEHRDLHWGNVLLQPASSTSVQCRLRGIDVAMQTGGVVATLIDFTASRLQAMTGDVAFCDLNADPELFQGPKNNCQADTYRRMMKATRGDWAGSHFTTNVLWMHYLADTLLTLKQLPGCTPAQKRALREFRRRALSYGSCGELIWDELFQGLWLASQPAAVEC